MEKVMKSAKQKEFVLVKEIEGDGWSGKNHARKVCGLKSRDKNAYFGFLDTSIIT